MVEAVSFLPSANGINQPQSHTAPITTYMQKQTSDFSQAGLAHSGAAFDAKNPAHIVCSEKFGTGNGQTQWFRLLLWCAVRLEEWGDRRDSNPQHPESQSGALPLSYGHQPSDRLDFVPGPVKFSATLNRDGDFKGRALADLGIDFHRAAVSFDGAANDGQSEAGPLRLGGAQD